jgi:hypothetical protein
MYSIYTVKGFAVIKKNEVIQVWWSMPVIAALGRLRKEDCEFEASLGYMQTIFQSFPNKNNDVVMHENIMLRD